LVLFFKKEHLPLELAMNGAESLVHTLVASGVEVCFGNPGTSEMHFVATLDRVEGIRPVLCLFEGVVTGAADGYGRMAGKPAATLLHLGPGLGNGWANLHNAKRGAAPIVNVVGDHARYHLQYDAPLTSDVKALAHTCSHLVHVSTNAKSVASDAARAVQAALAAPGQIATLILPADTAWDEADAPAPRLPVIAPASVAGETIDLVARLLRAGKRTAILMRGAALLDVGLDAAGRVAEATGAKLICDTFVPRLARGAGRVEVERIPYFAEQIVDFLAGYENLILVGAQPPVSFFAYPGKPSWCTPDGCRITYLAQPHEDGPGALQALAEAVGAAAHPAKRAALRRPDLPTGGISQGPVGMAMAALLPEGAVLIDEAATNGLAPYAFTANAAPHDYLGLTGGSIGWGLPVSVGAAVACPDRKIVCLHGDGGSMYTLQALWTQARENLDVITVIFANRSYAILNIELMRVGAGNGGPKALSMLDIGDPTLDFCKLAEGMGVAASRATTAEAFTDQFGDAVKQRGPRLIEVVL
jgi:acetolactate synthase-1/2/3 large subunit